MQKKSILSGLMWMSAAMILSKLASVMAQFVLGWKLDAEDFGLYAIAMSLGAIVVSMRNGGSDRVLIQRGGEYNTLAPVAFTLGLYFNLAAWAVLVLIAFFAADYYGEPVLVPVLTLIGLATVLATPMAILSAKLTIEQRFSDLAKVTTLSAILRQSLTIALALLGAGLFSLVIPMAIEPLFLAAGLYFVLRSWPRAKKVTKRDLTELFRSTKWTMMSSLAQSLNQYGQYISISFFIEVKLLGNYFFASALIASIMTLIVTPLSQVMLPSLSACADDKEEHQRLYRKAIWGSLLLGTLLGYGVYALIGPLMHLFWDGKWDASIATAQWMGLQLTGFLAQVLALTTIESKGLWKTRLKLDLILGGGIVLISAIAVQFTHNISYIAITITLFCAVNLVGLLLFVSSKLDVSMRATMRTLLIVWLLPLAVALGIEECVSRFVVVDQFHTHLALLVAISMYCTALFYRSEHWPWPATDTP